jgi:origin recognition complex subunit 4
MIAQQPKQLLLYNLFDIAQSSSSPICVLGLTARSDTLILFEKRVKSRFGHRNIDFYHLTDFDTYLDIAVQYLTIPNATTNYEKEWNQMVDALFEDGEVAAMLEEYFEIWNDIPHLQQLLSFLLRQVDEDTPFPSISMVESFMDQQKDYRTESIADCSLLEQSLTVAILKLVKNQEHEMNFEMVYDELRQFIGKVAAMGRGLGRLQFTKKVAMQVMVIDKAFEALEQMGIIKFDTGIGSKCPKEYRTVRVVLTRGQLEEALSQLQGVPDALKRWATSH